MNPGSRSLRAVLVIDWVTHPVEPGFLACSKSYTSGVVERLSIRNFLAVVPAHDPVDHVLGYRLAGLVEAKAGLHLVLDCDAHFDDFAAPGLLRELYARNHVSRPLSALRKVADKPLCARRSPLPPG